MEVPHDVACLVQHAERAVGERRRQHPAGAALDVVGADRDRGHAKQLPVEGVDAQRPVVSTGHVRAGPVEVDVLHEERAAGESKYSMYRLIRLNFDLITGFSLVPLQLFSVAGMIVALSSVVLYVFVIAQRAIVGGFVEGIKAFWDRDILAFFLIGCIMFGVGLLGEYVGRIYQQVRDRPRYVIRAVLERDVATEVPARQGVESVQLIR